MMLRIKSSDAPSGGCGCVTAVINHCHFSSVSRAYGFFLCWLAFTPKITTTTRIATSCGCDTNAGVMIRHLASWPQNFLGPNLVCFMCHRLNIV